MPRLLKYNTGRTIDFCNRIVAILACVCTTSAAFRCDVFHPSFSHEWGHLPPPQPLSLELPKSIDVKISVHSLCNSNDNKDGQTRKSSTYMCKIMWNEHDIKIFNFGLCASSLLDQPGSSTMVIVVYHNPLKATASDEASQSKKLFQ